MDYPIREIRPFVGEVPPPYLSHRLICQMGIERVYLDWNRPALDSAADHLIARFGTGGDCLDLREPVVVVPGARAGRRLEEILVEKAERLGAALMPPRVMTVGRLPELLYESQLAAADEMTQQLAWVRAIKGVGTETVRAFAPHLRDDADEARYLELAALLRRQHVELAAEGLDFSNVARLVGRMGQREESLRWHALRRVQQAYLDTLDRLELWDVQTARLVAIEKRECHLDRPILLLATVDMNRAMRKMLDQISGCVTALVHAPEVWGDRFDDYGCLVPDAWQQVPLDVDVDRVHVVGGPNEQAEAVARCLADLDGRRRADEITIGAADPSIVPHIRRSLETHGASIRWGPGQSLAETRPYRLLAAIATYVDRQRFRDFAALVRHPDVFHWIVGQDIPVDWLTELDEYFNRHLPSRAKASWLGSESTSARIRRVAQAISLLLEPLTTKLRPISQWAAPISSVLAEIFAGRTLDREHPEQRAALRACEHIRRAASLLEQLPSSLSVDISASRAIGLILGQLDRATIPPPPQRDAIEALGWLELPLDDAPVLVVTSLCEGFVPQSVNADPFLPNALRQRLGLLDNARRYARDAYALSVLLATRQQLDLVVGRRSGQGDPMTPSRLLFATGAEEIAARAIRFFAPKDDSPARRAVCSDPRLDGDAMNFGIPKAVPPAEPIDRMRVTAFRDYLACPYRFYLRHVLKLESLGDAVEELGGGAFGTLIHDVLCEFGQSDVRDATDPIAIRAFLGEELDRQARRLFGNSPLAAVAIQIEQARFRLDAFADFQAARAADGWCIEHVELAIDDPKAAISVDGKPMLLRGRIDRIDVHRPTGRRTVLDYKTGDSPKRPDQTHRDKEGMWIDLQLPLYRHLVRATGIDGPISLGYLALPKDRKQAGLLEAKWSQDDLEEADEVAADVIRTVRAGRFDRMAPVPPPFAEDFAAICRDNVLGRRALADAQGEAE